MTPETDFVSVLLSRLGTSPSPHEVVEVLVPEAADLVLMFARDRDEVRLVAFRHIDPEQHPVLEVLASLHRPSWDHPTDPVATVMRTGTAVLSPWVRREQVERVTTDVRVHELFEVLQPRAIVITPLSRESVCYGALVIAMSASRRRFIHEDLDVMQEFAQRIGPIIRIP